MTPRDDNAAHGAHGPCETHLPGIDYGVLDTLVGYGVRRAQLVIHEDFVQTLAAWNITPQRFSALTVIARNAGLKLTHLAHILGIARSGAVLVVDALAAIGYVERQPSPADRRAYGLALTERGQADLTAITEAVCAHDRRMVSRLDAGEARELMRLLRQVVASRT